MRLNLSRYLLLLGFLVYCLHGTAQGNEILRAGLLITKSVSIENQQYLIEADSSLKLPLIRISGKNIEVDFNQAILNGTKNPDRPNLMHGLALYITPGSENITIKNLNLHGYKIALMAESVKHLSIINCNFSYNFRPELFSTREKEDERDWMSYHHNESGELQQCFDQKQPDLGQSMCSADGAM